MPAIRTSPPVGRSKALKCWIRVDFPDPVGPMRPTNSPASMERVTSWRATASSGVPCKYTWVRWRHSMSSIASPPPPRPLRHQARESARQFFHEKNPFRDRQTVAPQPVGERRDGRENQAESLQLLNP